MKHRASRSDRRNAQTLTEYVILGSIIAIGGLTTILLFGNVILGTFSRIPAALRDDSSPPDNTIAQQALGKMQSDEDIARNMANFDTGDSGGTPSGMPPGPSSPPVAPDPMVDASTHHLGDSSDGEGLAYNFGFELTQEMIDYANYASDGTLFITFDAGNHVADYNNFIQNEHVDAVMFNGQVVGYAANGRNTISVDIASLRAGQQRLTFSSGILSTDGTRVEHDDFNISNTRIGYSAR